MEKISRTFLTILTGVFLLPLLAQAQLATTGPYQVKTAEYRFAATTDTDILKDRKTEIWARVFWPQDKTTGQIPAQLPMAVFLHGNHGTCGAGFQPRLDEDDTYTYSGECPQGYVVTPNHEGYNYIIEELASWGYVVISINANRGITSGGGVTGDSGLNLARGRLILKHLSLWNTWATIGNAPSTLVADAQSFVGKIDFSHVGLFGHSRGGEGVRAAYNLYYDLGSSWVAQLPKLKIEAIFEIGAVDGQTSRILDAQNTVWNQLIPICDGDVSDFEGIRPFNRMVQTAGLTGSGQKSVYLVYGANHNFFNTEWQDNDSYGCNMHDPLWTETDWESKQQQSIAKKMVVDFFKANLGSNKLKKLNDAFNPVMPVDLSISNITHIEREFSPNPNLTTQIRFDDFISKDILRETSTNLTAAIEVGTNALSSTLKMNWTPGQDETYVKLTRSMSVDVSGMKTLDLRFSLPGKNSLTEAFNMTVSLKDDQGVESTAVQLKNYALKTFNPFYATLYQTVRIGMDQLTGVDLKHIKTIQFKMVSPTTGTAYLAHIRFSLMVAEMTLNEDPFEMNSLPIEQKLNGRPHDGVQNLLNLISHAMELTQITGLKFLPQDDITQSQVAITFASRARFKIRDALPILKVGEHEFQISKIKNSPELSQITFYLSLSDLELIKESKETMKIMYQGNALEQWLIHNTLAL